MVPASILVLKNICQIPDSREPEEYPMCLRRSASLGRGRQVGSWQVHCASAFFNIYLRITIASNIERRDL